MRDEWDPFGTEGETADRPFVSPVHDFYRTCPISRASETMAACVEEIVDQDQEEATGTHG
jgi:NADH-quinone oxidoreductase subunit G